MNEILKEKLKKLPNRSGVYFHKDASGEVIYVGKAKNLKNRVSSYFRGDHDLKTRKLVAEIVDTEWREVETEMDALFLESEMIKRYMPKFNILLRDDKAASYVRINLKEPVPYVSLVKNPLDDGAEYFGPFYSAAPIKTALRVLRRVFPYYTKGQPSKSKLNRDLGLEPAANDEKYIADLRKLMSYLRGNRNKLAREVEVEMKTASAERRYEDAAELRNQLRALKSLDTAVIFGRDEFVDISTDKALGEMKKLLDLKEPPRRIEAYDISHTGGKNVAGSMVVFTNGVADKKEYRKFRLHSQKNDDYASLVEVITRRLKHLHDWGRPSLVLIDGGVGQLSAVAELLAAEKIPFVGRAKAGKHGGNVTTELILADGRAVPLDNKSHLAKLVARIDDEAHRFAINYHTLLRKKNMLK
jgi:excinuclease ABC subunit C